MKYTEPEAAVLGHAIELIHSATVKLDPVVDSPILHTRATSAAYESDE
ncbi:MAG: hypothetical protein L0338_25695 [Acidobacteria bacterium]|nr:hypothetical protein [Acidobacteriota bacterium]